VLLSADLMLFIKQKDSRAIAPQCAKLRKKKKAKEPSKSKRSFSDVKFCPSISNPKF